MIHCQPHLSTLIVLGKVLLSFPKLLVLHSISHFFLLSHILPIQPELLSGTLRSNLDPFNEHDDATLNNALRSAGLFELQKDAEENKITLDTDISSGGSNLSVGQRQILALARAMVRESKLLILDEGRCYFLFSISTSFVYHVWI